MTQIVGITRFSYLGLSDWIGARQINRSLLAEDNLRARADRLYDEARMTLRFQAFERILLPSLKAQTDEDFIHIMLTSPEMPDPWLARLRAACRPVTQIHVVVTAERNVRYALRPALIELAEANGGPVVQFRVDDDDALGRHFIARLRKHTGRFKDMPEFAISLSKGLVLRSYGGAPVEQYRFNRAFVSAGAAVRFKHPGRAIYDLDHFRLAAERPSFTDPSSVNYLHLRWDAADTAHRGRADIPDDMTPLPPEQFARDAAAEFPMIDFADLDFIRTSQA